jgi:hypothetical protein
MPTSGYRPHCSAAGLLWAGLIFNYFSLLYKYLKILGMNNKEKIPIPTINIISAGCQWFILNMTPKPVNENDIAPVINANFFIFTFL